MNEEYIKTRAACFTQFTRFMNKYIIHINNQKTLARARKYRFLFMTSNLRLWHHNKLSGVAQRGKRLTVNIYALSYEMVKYRGD